MKSLRKVVMVLLVAVVIVGAFAACDAAHEHSFGEWVVTTEPTCTSAGVKTKTCECGETETEEIAMIAHAWVDATCTAPKTCSVCKATEGTPLQHKYSNNECEYCGSQDPAYTELLLGASIYSDLLDSAADVESVGNYISRAWYFAIYEADGISLGSDGIKEFAEFIEADEEFVDEVVTEYLITVGYSQNQITAAIKADALNSIDYAVEIAMWLCENAGLTNEIESNLQKCISAHLQHRDNHAASKRSMLHHITFSKINCRYLFLRYLIDRIDLIIGLLRFITIRICVTVSGVFIIR